MNTQIYNLESTISSNDFNKFYKVATGSDKCLTSMNDIRRCLMLFYNMRVMGVDVDYVYKQAIKKGKIKTTEQIKEIKR
jgi:hypothetical protein